VLQAAAIGESGQVLVLDMGEPVKIVELARQLIRLSGHALEEIPVEFSGVRAGEKMYEELLVGPEGTVATAVPRLSIARIRPGAPGLPQALRQGVGPTADGPVPARRLLAEWVPEFGPAQRADTAAAEPHPRGDLAAVSSTSSMRSASALRS
jgi:hypothetical protein